jgi:iron complex outermembrane receptor protein
MRKLLIFISCLIICCAVTGIDLHADNSTIHGKITDTSGNPLQGTGITIRGTYLGTYSDNEGKYIFSGLHDGKYTLVFSFVGFEQQTRSIELKGEAIVDVVLAPAPFLTEEVTVNATRAGEKAPMAYSVIDKGLLKKSNTGQDMPFLLSLTPSLVETSEAGNGVGYTSLRIRGTDANRINVTIDGIPLNEPESQTVFWVDLPDLASSVDNIQVQRGVGSSSNGAGAFGATLSIQTINPENEPSADISSSVGSFNTFKNTVSAATGLLGNRFALQMRYSDLKSDGYVLRTGSDHRSAFISGVYKTERSRLKANIIIGEEHTGIGWWGVPKDSLATNRRYNPAGEYTDENGNLKYYNNESDNYNQDHFQLIYSHKAGQNLNINAALHYTKGKGYYEEFREDQSFAEYGLEPFNIGTTAISTSDMIRRKWMSTDFYGLVYSFKYRKNRLEATAGGGMNIYNGDHYGTLIWMSNAGNIEKDHMWYLNNAKKSEFSIFGKVNYSITGKLSAYGDLQFRHIFYNISGPDDDLKDISQEHSYDFFNPKAGLFYSINTNQDAYVSFSVANREPTRSDFKEAAGDPNATPKPETLYDTELGYKLRSGKSSLSANVYGMFYKDQLVPTGQLSDVGYTIMTNVDKSYRFGIELSAALKLSRMIEWNASMTLSRNKIKDFTEYYTEYNTSDWSSSYVSKHLGDVDIAYSPSKLFTSTVTFQPVTWFSVDLISKYVGKQYFDNTMSSERSIDPYFVNNLRLNYNPEIRNLKGLELQLAINNIFGEVYENNAYGGNWYEDGNEKTWSYYFPQAGINYMVRLALKF